MRSSCPERDCAHANSFDSGSFTLPGVLYSIDLEWVACRISTVASFRQEALIPRSHPSILGDGGSPPRPDRSSTCHENRAINLRNLDGAPPGKPGPDVGGSTVAFSSPVDEAQPHLDLPRNSGEGVGGMGAYHSDLQAAQIRAAQPPMDGIVHLRETLALWVSATTKEAVDNG